MEKLGDQHIIDVPQIKTKYEKLAIPGTLQIGKYRYIYKDQSKVDLNTFTYRCQNSNCRIPINITRENINKINNKENAENISYIQKKEHKCAIVEEKIEKAVNCSTEKEMMLIAQKIMTLNPLKPLSYITQKLEENNIFLDKNKILNLIYKIRNSIFPKDTEYINNIASIRIDYDEKVENAKNLPFCQCLKKFINIDKNNRQEQFIIFSSYFQLNFLAKCSNIFIDATFKSSPHNFYQLLNIIAYNNKENFTMPVSYILMFHKSFIPYKNIIKELKSLLEEYNIEVQFKGISFMSDFEFSLMRAIREEFSESISCPMLLIQIFEYFSS